MNIEDLFKGYGYIQTDMGSHDIEGLTRFTKRCNANTLYFHLNKDRSIPNDLCAAAIVIDDECNTDSAPAPLIRVKSARAAYAFACSNFEGIDYTKFKIIGITGTNGKTSSALMLKKILECASSKVGFIGTGRIEIGDELISEEKYSMTCPDPEILYPALKKMEKAGCNMVVMEVSSHALALEKVAPILFETAVFTGLSSEHLDFHKDMESYFKEKEKLIKRARYAIINADDSYGRRLLSEYKEKCISAGILWQSDVSVSDIEYLGLDGLKYIYYTQRYRTMIRLSLLGYCNIYNSMLATATATSLGVKPCECKAALASIGNITGRFEVLKDAGINIIIDYAHTPFALENLLNSLKTIKIPRQKTTIVFGCGGNRDRAKRPKMAAAAERGAKRVVVTTDNPRDEDPTSIICDIVSGFSNSSYAIIQNRALAIEYAILTAEAGSTVVIAGKGAEAYMYSGGEYIAFNDRSMIESAIEKRKGFIK